MDVDHDLQRLDGVPVGEVCKRIDESGIPLSAWEMDFLRTVRGLATMGYELSRKRLLALAEIYWRVDRSVYRESDAA